MPWDLDKEGLIKLIVVLFFVGVWIVQILFRALGKASRKVDEARRRGEAPAKDIRDFLKEIRGQGAEAPPEPPPIAAHRAPERPEGERREAPPWRDAPRHRRTMAPAGEPIGAGPVTIAREPASAEHLKRSVHEYLDELARQARAEEAQPMTVMPPMQVIVAESPEAAHRAHSSLEESLARRFGESPAAEEAARLAATRAGVLPGGFTLRQAILAQTILGPPRARQFLRRPRSRT